MRHVLRQAAGHIHYFARRDAEDRLIVAKITVVLIFGSFPCPSSTRTALRCAASGALFTESPAIHSPRRGGATWTNWKRSPGTERVQIHGVMQQFNFICEVWKSLNDATSASKTNCPYLRMDGNSNDLLNQMVASWQIDRTGTSGKSANASISGYVWLA